MYKKVRRTLSVIYLSIIAVITSVFSYILIQLFPTSKLEPQKIEVKVDTTFTNLWYAPSEWRLKIKENANEIKYGRELIAHTSKYLGPNGSVRQISNGINCQNCHLDAGTRPFGNNYFAVWSTYPKMRARSGKIENIEKRINDCFERSLNGKGLDSSSKEMRAMKAYMQFLGSDVPKKMSPRGSGIYKIPLLSRAANPNKGESLYQSKCASCHQSNGEGLMTADKKEYTYPPLWGAKSYNSGAGLYRMSNLAGYIKYNMPLGASIEKPQLSDEESWDIAAFVNTQKRPIKDISRDWPNIAKKPFDHPFGPYIDPFSESQHKYGPFKPIKKWYKEHQKN